jgi:hypothetical protein
MDTSVKDLTEMMFEAESNLCEIDGSNAAIYHLAYTALLDIFQERITQYEKEMDVIRERWAKENVK